MLASPNHFVRPVVVARSPRSFRGMGTKDDPPFPAYLLFEFALDRAIRQVMILFLREPADMMEAFAEGSSKGDSTQARMR